MQDHGPLTHRLATLDDLDALRDLMDRSIRGILSDFLDQEHVEASFEMMGLDTQLVIDGTYFVVEAEGRIVGSGGWGRRATLFGGDHALSRDGRLLDPTVEPARIRAMYTDPDFVRRGIGRLVLALCEDAARQAGFRSVELVATAAGEPFYLATGFRLTERIGVATSGGVSVPCARMVKEL